MPMYSYLCKACETGFERFHLMVDSDTVELCPKCSFVAHKIPVMCNLITDTNFVGTGTYDNRVCDNRDDKIEGRKDWRKRLKERQLRELDWSEVKNPKAPKPKPCM